MLAFWDINNVDLNIQFQEEPATTPNNHYGQIIASFKKNVHFIDEKWECPAKSFSPFNQKC